MRWRALFFLRNDKDDSDIPEAKDTFGFRTRKCPPQVDELVAFEDDLMKLIENLQFRRIKRNELQRRLDKDTERIKSCKDVIIPADKTRNLYMVSKKSYDKLLVDNITKSYRPAPSETYNLINEEARDIATRLDIADRMNCMAKKEAFITLKDHKENFSRSLPCRLINPAKSEMGKVSKVLLDRIISDVKKHLPLNMWKNTGAVTDWFSRIDRKQECTFVCFDIVDFYPSITEDLLTRALVFANRFTRISQQDKDIIFNARKSMLFGHGKEWIKKGTGLFDVTMGCFDGAEICELVGLYALSELANVVPAESIGLYRDDGLGILRKTPGNKADKIRKDIIKAFMDLGLKITIQINLKVTDFLDVSLNLSTGTFSPFRKPNDRPLYIHRHSNHPPTIIKNLPASISRRLTDISSSEEVFSNAKPLYDNALRESGFSDQTVYLEERKEGARAKRQRRSRKITWFNPPFSQNVATNIGRKFRSLVSAHFPRSSKLNKIFNHNTLKVSYSCMPNMATIIKSHNSAIVRRRTSAEKEQTGKKCNCRVKADCPLNGECLTTSVVYRATVKSRGEEKEYTGLTALTFKQRFYAHQHSIRHRENRHSTTLSNHVWSLKDRDRRFTIKWTVLRKAAAYQNASKKCNLCTAEKLEILRASKDRSLNRRSELVSKCRHENRFYLCNFPPPTP